MPGPAWNPSGAVRFDLKSGAAEARGNRVVLLPAGALDGLDAAALAHVGSALGRACGARVSAELGGESGVRNAQMEIVVSHLAGELGIVGFGSVHLERWGRAMVLVVENAASMNDTFVSAVLASAMHAATGREVAMGSLGQGRYFVGSPGAVAKARSMVAQGTAWAEVLSSLQKVSA